MAVIHFRSATSATTVRVTPPAGARRTLLAVAKDAGVPLLFNCEAGDCGACVVDVETRAVGRHRIFSLTEKERFLLGAMGRLSAAEVDGSDDRPAAVRLACQYEIHDEEIVVTFVAGLGG